MQTYRHHLSRSIGTVALIEATYADRRALWAATDPVEPVHDYHIPIRPFKRPPTKDDLQQIRRRRKQQETEHDHPAGNPPGEEGHVDDYA